ncbi:MAG TPA: hypothetical protein VK395_11055 [Gemmataceae bacterium]|nr:hypothetical protein [Gemmataceae bacterium]
MSLDSFLHRLGSSNVPPRRKRRSRWARPLLEVLEDRLAPAVFTVVNNSDSGIGSLREALGDSNSFDPGPNIIDFNIPVSTPGAVALITPASLLPVITTVRLCPLSPLMK